MFKENLFSVRNNILKICFFLLLIISIHSSYAQTAPTVKSIDTLKLNTLLENLENAESDSVKIVGYLKLFDFYSSTDELQSYYYFNQAIKIIENSEATYSYSIYKLFSKRVGFFNNYEENDRVYIAFEDKLTASIKDLMYFYYTVAYNYSVQQEYEKAARFAGKALTFETKIKNKDLLSELYMYIAFVFRNIDRATLPKEQSMERALHYFRKSIKYCDTIKQPDVYANSLREIANAYSFLDRTDSVLFYHHKAINIANKTNSITWFYYNDLSDYFFQIKEYDSALYYNSKVNGIINEKDREFYLNSVISIYVIKTISLKKYSPTILINPRYVKNIINFEDRFYPIQKYINIFLSLNELDSSEYYINLYGKYSSITNQKEQLYTAFYYKYLLYKAKGKYYDALNYQDSLKRFQDSLSSLEIIKNLNTTRIKYEVAQKDNEILNNQLKIKQQRIYIFTFITAFVLIVVFLIWVVRLLQKIKNANSSLTIQNQHILQQKEEIVAQRDEIESQRNEIEIQRDYAVRQRDEITEKNRTILSSIQYAQRIQHALLPSHENLKLLFNQHFVFFKPRDLVSGDFFWIKQINNNIFIAVADCTGHGVPGALVSMMGISMLNDIVRRDIELTTNNILDNLRSNIKLALQQTGKDNEQKDGMDIALCKLDSANRILQFSGANNAAWLIMNNEITELQPDHQPIGIYIKETPFNCVEINLKEDTLLYLSSDGFVDQFNGITREKFKKKRLRELLSTISKNDLKQQETILNKTFAEWKGNTEQTDDITILGVKI